MFGAGTQEHPWICQKPDGVLQFSAYRDRSVDPPELVILIDAAEHRYRLDCLETQHGRWDQGASALPVGLHWRNRSSSARLASR
jgi:hypothetical protein